LQTQDSSNFLFSILNLRTAGGTFNIQVATNLFQNVSYISGNGPGTKRAIELANTYDKNENKIMAYSFVMEALFETTETGELLTKARESIVETYGGEASKDASEVYGAAIELIKGIKDQVPGGKMSDFYIDATAIAFGLKVTYLHGVDAVLGMRIRLLDSDVYNSRILKIINNNGGGGGASSDPF
jgi:hypothetical protein